MGSGLLGWAANITCITWTIFVSVIFSLPTVLPVNKENMNYASVSYHSLIIVMIVLLISITAEGHHWRRSHSVWVSAFNSIMYVIRY